MNIWDILRFATAILYMILIAQTFATVMYYRAARKNEQARGINPPGILPFHVVSIGIVLMALAGEAVFQNLERIGEGFSWYAILNPVIFIVANYAIHLITHFERTRYTLSK